MTQLKFQRVELDDDLPILKITDVSGCQLHYLIGEDGNLILGRPIRAFVRDGNCTVTFFCPLGGVDIGIPTVLKVVNHGS